MNIAKKIPAFLLATVLLVAQMGVAAADSGVPPNSPTPSKHPEHACAVSFQGITLSVDGNSKYVEADYTFDENCRPVLVAVRRGDHLPEADKPQNAVESATTTTNADPFSPFAASTQAAVTAATNVCHTETWETDFAYLRTVQVQNDTTWTWNGSSVTYWSVTATAKQYFTWWYRYNGPNANGGWNPYPTNVWGKADASFYCNGGPFCGGGPMYYITLEAWTNVNKSGNCSGYGVYSGTVIPGGHVLYRNWKD